MCEQAHNWFRHAIEIFSRTSLPERYSRLTQIYTNMALSHKEQSDLDACLIDYELAIKYTAEDFHELPKIQKAIETLMHEKNNNGQEESTMNVKKV